MPRFTCHFIGHPGRNAAVLTWTWRRRKGIAMGFRELGWAERVDLAGGEPLVCGVQSEVRGRIGGRDSLESGALFPLAVLSKNFRCGSDGTKRRLDKPAKPKQDPWETLGCGKTNVDTGVWRVESRRKGEGCFREAGTPAFPEQMSSPSESKYRAPSPNTCQLPGCLL